MSFVRVMVKIIQISFRFLIYTYVCMTLLKEHTYAQAHMSNVRHTHTRLHSHITHVRRFRPIYHI